MEKNLDLTLGVLSNPSNKKHKVRVWAPFTPKMSLELIEADQSKLISMSQEDDGFFSVELSNIASDAKYYFCFGDDKKYPDPASRFQPEGIKGPSQFYTADFKWEDQDWQGLNLNDYIIYEMHVGTFSAAGTFEGIIPFLNELQNLGITALELMPVCQFQGTKNWGYDGAFPFAVQNSYGGPHGLRKLINACHKHKIAVIIDLAFNRIGAEGNFFTEFGPYFTNETQTLWGKAVNFDEAFSHHVRRYFIENALYWIKEFHVDAIRLGALHTIIDKSAYPFLNELSDHVHAYAEKIGREIYIIAESDLNNTRIILPQFKGGYELDAQWNDDYHHSLHALLTHERTGYYEDYGKFQDFLKAYREGFVYTGQYSSYRKRPHGSSSKHIEPQHFIIYMQNHDQIGNRYQGERLTELLSFAQLRLVAALTILSPYVPLIFMGEEYAEVSPFKYFATEDQEIFELCKLNHDLKKADPHQSMWFFYQKLIKLRKSLPAIFHLSKENMMICADDKKNVVCVKRYFKQQTLFIIFHFNSLITKFSLDIPEGQWKKIFDIQNEGLETENILPEIINAELHLQLPPYCYVIYEKVS